MLLLEDSLIAVIGLPFELWVCVAQKSDLIFLVTLFQKRTQKTKFCNEITLINLKKKEHKTKDFFREIPFIICEGSAIILFSI